LLVSETEQAERKTGLVIKLRLLILIVELKVGDRKDPRLTVWLVSKRGPEKIV